MPLLTPAFLSPVQHLALDRARFGLTRRIGGWASTAPGADPDDLVAVHTVKALAAKGLLTVEGHSARLSGAPRPC